MKSLPRSIFLFCLAAVLLLGLIRSVDASSSLADPRLNRLESQVRSLQSQVTRLQSQIPRSSSSRVTPTNLGPAPDAPSFDQQFDTLAILILELQDRVSALEDRLRDPEEFSPQR